MLNFIILVIGFGILEKTESPIITAVCFTILHIMHVLLSKLFIGGTYGGVIDFVLFFIGWLIYFVALHKLKKTRFGIALYIGGVMGCLKGIIW